MDQPSRTPPPDRAAGAPEQPVPPPHEVVEDVEKKDVEAGDADRVKGGLAGVKKTMATQ